MTLNRIDPSVLARTNVVERFKDTQRQDGSRDKTGNNESGIPAAGREQNLDRAEISDTARRLMELRKTVDEGLEAMSDHPEVREAKIAEARQRLTQGYYHSLQVTEEIARKLDRTFDAIDEL